MSESNLNEEVDGASSSTEYWPDSGSSVAATLSPESNLSEEIEWEELHPTITDNLNHDIVNPPQLEPANDVILNEDFIRYIERFLLFNLFMLSPATLWNLYTQLSLYYSMCANTVESVCVVEIPPMEGGEDDPSELQLEPPVLNREQ